MPKELPIVKQEEEDDPLLDLLAEHLMEIMQDEILEETKKPKP